MGVGWVALGLIMLVSLISLGPIFPHIFRVTGDIIAIQQQSDPFPIPALPADPMGFIVKIQNFRSRTSPPTNRPLTTPPLSPKWGLIVNPPSLTF